MKRFVMILFLLFADTVGAQNLVVNPGFEENYYSTSKEFKWVVLDDIHPHGWSMPTIGSSDIFVVPDSEDPLISRVRPAPFEGKVYAAFLSDHSKKYYEYVEGSLEEPLVANTIYTVSLVMATYEEWPDDLTGLGCAFSSDKIAYPYDFGCAVLPLSPSATFDTVNVTEQKSSWKLISFRYTAKGGEKYFTIGDFGTAAQLHPVYYYMDSVSVTGPPAEAAIDSIATQEPLIAAGKTLTLTNIYFETGKSTILPQSYQPLYDVIVELKLQPNLKVEIVGHTDKHGDPKANQKLSEDRAKAVADFFISKGIDASRITTRGCGSSQPVGDDDQKNRRVEFIFSQ